MWWDHNQEEPGDLCTPKTRKVRLPPSPRNYTDGVQVYTPQSACAHTNLHTLTLSYTLWHAYTHTHTQVAEAGARAPAEAALQNGYTHISYMFGVACVCVLLRACLLYTYYDYCFNYTCTSVYVVVLVLCIWCRAIWLTFATATNKLLSECARLRERRDRVAVCVCVCARACVFAFGSLYGCVL